MGTVAYMSPKQAKGETVWCPSDIFSVGLVLYEMLVGAPAFLKNSMAETLSALSTKHRPVSVTQAAIFLLLGRLRLNEHPIFPVDLFGTVTRDQEARESRGRV